MTHHTPYADWLFNRREEARKLHLANYREWLAAGARPHPIYAREA